MLYIAPEKNMYQDLFVYISSSCLSILSTHFVGVQYAALLYRLLGHRWNQNTQPFSSPFMYIVWACTRVDFYPKISDIPYYLVYSALFDKCVLLKSTTTFYKELCNSGTSQLYVIIVAVLLMKKRYKRSLVDKYSKARVYCVNEWIYNFSHFCLLMPNQCHLRNEYSIKTLKLNIFRYWCLRLTANFCRR